MSATIEYSYICIEMKNTPQAIKVLEEALELLEGPMKEQIELDWMVELKRGKLYTQMGRAMMSLEDDEAYKHFINALSCYGISFPTTNIVKHLLKGSLKLRQSTRLYFCQATFKRAADEDLAEYCNNVSECLHLLSEYFADQEKWVEAELAAVWSLTKALETETDFEMICLAYGSMIRVACTTGQHTLCVGLEVFALRMCLKKKTIVEIEEMKAVSMLYIQIGRARFVRGEISKCMQMGYPIWRITNAARFPEFLFKTFPVLAYGTILRKQVVEFGNILNEMTYLIDQDVDNSEKIWYYALCLVLHLETGLIAQTTEKCNLFMQCETFGEEVKDPTAKCRLIICKWLWELRNDNWDGATMWQHSAWNYKITDNGEHVHHLITGLYLLEGLIIYMVNKMDLKNMRASDWADSFICDLFGKLTRASKFCPILLPRLYHMKAYYVMAKYNNYKKALKLLTQAHRVAEKQRNDLEMDWTVHSEQAWGNRLLPEERFGWQAHCEEDNYLRLSDVDVGEQTTIPYSLPLPLYV